MLHVSTPLHMCLWTSGLKVRKQFVSRLNPLLWRPFKFPFVEGMFAILHSPFCAITLIASRVSWQTECRLTLTSW